MSQNLKTREKNSSLSSTASNSLRPRLASILSYFSSSSSGTATTDSLTSEEVALMTICEKEWVKDRRFDFNSLEIGN